MRSLISQAATRLLNPMEFREVEPFIDELKVPRALKGYLLECMYSREEFYVNYRSIVDLPQACFVFDEGARVDLKRTVKRAEVVLDPVVLFKLQCATSCTENLVKTWYKCSEEEQLYLASEVDHDGYGYDDTLWSYKASKILAQLHGMEADAPSLGLYHFCVTDGWHDAALDVFCAQNEDAKVELFFEEWYFSMKNSDFRMFFKLQPYKNFVIRPTYIRDVLMRDKEIEGFKGLLELRERSRVPRECIVPEIEEVFEEIRRICC
uniref:Aminoglycoside phosphotransferase n=1 Tax=Steinernema glaseri TaxID=37863 RepID=A0A1I7YCE2_9BILA